MFFIIVSDLADLYPHSTAFKSNSLFLVFFKKMDCQCWHLKKIYREEKGKSSQRKMERQQDEEDITLSSREKHLTLEKDVLRNDCYSN